jgi:hypothetical protein
LAVPSWLTPAASNRFKPLPEKFDTQTVDSPPPARLASITKVTAAGSSPVQTPLRATPAACAAGVAIDQRTELNSAKPISPVMPRFKVNP